jgi:hypothetical protein
MHNARLNGGAELPAGPGSTRFVGGGVARRPGVGVGPAVRAIVIVATAESTAASPKAAWAVADVATDPAATSASVIV